MARSQKDIQAEVDALNAQRNGLYEQQRKWQQDAAQQFGYGMGGMGNPYDAQLKALQDRQNVLDMERQGLNPDGSPIRPEWESLIDPQTGKMKDNYQLNLQTLDPATLQGYNMIKNLATQEGPSKSAQYQTEQANLLKQNNIDAATQQAAGAQADARSQLAMRGGMASGSRERLAQAGQRDLLGSKQAAFRQNTGNILDILKTDEDAKRQALSQFANAEGQIAGSNLGIKNKATEFNTTNLLSEAGKKREADMEAYKSALDKWSANKQAEATRNSGGGGGGK